MSEANELVSVNLKMLINLAKPAATLNLFRSRIRAQQSGGYVSRVVVMCLALKVEAWNLMKFDPISLAMIFAT